MPALKELTWCGNVAFRNSTRKLSKETLSRIIQDNDIRFVYDVIKHPDKRIAELMKVNGVWVNHHIPEGHTASIQEIERFADKLRIISATHRVLVISYHGRNRAPCLAAMACDDRKEVERLLQNKQYFTIPFFRTLLEE